MLVLAHLTDFVTYKETGSGSLGPRLGVHP